MSVCLNPLTPIKVKYALADYLDFLLFLDKLLVSIRIPLGRSTHLKKSFKQHKMVPGMLEMKDFGIS